MWVVELNILGCRFRRSAVKRRNLLALPARSFALRGVPLRRSRVA